MGQIKFQKEDSQPSVFGDDINKDEITLKQQNEIAETIERMNPVSENSKHNQVEYFARTDKFVEPFMVAYNTSAWIGVISKKHMALTELAMRISVGREGLGRKEIVEIHQSKTDVEQGKGFGGWMKNFTGIGR